jgi:hypothetical protein
MLARLAPAHSYFTTSSLVDYSTSAMSFVRQPFNVGPS